MAFNHIRVTPSNTELAPDTVTEQIGALHREERESEGLNRVLSLFGFTNPPTYEFLAHHDGGGGLKFYYGAEEQIDTLHERVRVMYPDSYKLERVGKDPLTHLAPDTLNDLGETGSEEVMERLGGVVGVEWMGEGVRKQDWMTTLPRYSSIMDPGSCYSRAPLASLIDECTKTDHPLVFQAVFRRKKGWSAEAERRRQRLRNGTDRRIDRFLGTPEDGKTTVRTDGYLDPGGRERARLIREKQPTQTFSTNLRLLIFSSDEAGTDSLHRCSSQLSSVFNHLSGQYYHLTTKQRKKTPLRSWMLRRLISSVLQRSLRTKGWGRVKPDIVLHPDELANFVVVPPSNSLPSMGGRETEPNPETGSPLPRPKPSHLDRYREGMAIGYAVKMEGEPEQEPVRLPHKLLPLHYLRVGSTGSGKSKSLINDALSLYGETTGPVLLIDPKGDGLARNYMRAHAVRYGFRDLEENVIHFPAPRILPGFSFFNIKNRLGGGRKREDVIQDKADHYEEILELVMGGERYRQAIVAPNLIKYLIKTLYDESYGLENGVDREDTDYFTHTDLEHQVHRLYKAKSGDRDDTPVSSDEDIQRRINQVLETNPKSFAALMSGVSNRLDYITQDNNLRRIFNNTEPRFDFHDILDKNKVVLFDLGGLRGEAKRILTGVILTMLLEALETRERQTGDRGADYVVNLLVDEAASIAVSGIMNELLEKGRSFRLSVGLSLQFPEQIREEGGHQLYLNTLNDIGTKLVGKIPVDREIAHALSNEDINPNEFRNRIRALPRGEWIAQLPSPEFGETGPQPFTLKPLPIPQGHPESNQPLQQYQETRFEAAVDRVNRKTRHRYGNPQTHYKSKTQDRDELTRQQVQLTQLLATTTQAIQSIMQGGEGGGWIPYHSVMTELNYLYGNSILNEPPPNPNELKDYALQETGIEIKKNGNGEIRIRYSVKNELDTGTNTNDNAGESPLEYIQINTQALTELSNHGLTIDSEEINGEPVVTATHQDKGTSYKVERLVPGDPKQILMMYKRALDHDLTPLYLVPEGRKYDSLWVGYVEQVLNPPIRYRDTNEIHYYTLNEPFRFDGGARSKDGVTAVRPHHCGSRNDFWSYNGEEIVLRDAHGNRHMSLPDISSVGKEDFPAIYSYDLDIKEHVVYKRGETYKYESQGMLRKYWVVINKPFMIGETPPATDIDPNTYEILPIPLHDGINEELNLTQR